MVAEVIKVGEFANDLEREAVEYLRGHLSSDYTLYHNLELKKDKEIFEIDLVVLAPHCVYLIDIKGTLGLVRVREPNWYPDNRQPFPSPLKKLRSHAKTLKSLIADSYLPKRQILQKIHIQEAVLMMAENSQVIDETGLDEDKVLYAGKHCLDYLKSPSCIPYHRLDKILDFKQEIRNVLKKAVPPSALKRYGNWQIEEKLGAEERYTEYRAKGASVVNSGLPVRLRIYNVDIYQAPEIQALQLKVMTTAYRAVYQLRHSGILRIQDCIETNDGDRIVLVIEDLPSEALYQYAKRSDLSLEKKFGIIREVLIALHAAHQQEIIHRNLTLDSILITPNGTALLTGFDYARIGDQQSTIADQIQNALEPYAVYQAPECQNDPSKATVATDLFAAGAVFYEFLTGRLAFESAVQMIENQAIFPVKPSSCEPSLAWGIDQWLQKMCAFQAGDRFPDADSALQALTDAAKRQSVDYHNLLPGELIADQYQIVKWLGTGSFGVVYKAVDVLINENVVLKLITYDRYSVYDRVIQEYKTLRQVPDHPNVVKIIYIGLCDGSVPYIIFEHIDGLDVQQYIDDRALSFDDVIQIARDTALGLSHLHQHGIYHQDIKPPNLLLTDQGVKIIDFNVAVSEQDENPVNGRTNRYIPPDFSTTVELDRTARIDRDLYALGITIYECLTGRYPFETGQPSLTASPINPQTLENCEQFSDELVQILMKAISSNRSDRFTSAQAFLDAIDNLSLPKNAPPPTNSLEDQPAQPTEIEQDESPLANQVEVPDKIPATPDATILENSPSPTQENQKAIVTYPPPPKNKRSKRKPIASEVSLLKTPSIFDLPPLPPLKPIELGQGVILDRTKLYPIPPGCISVTTEVEWMKKFYVTEGLYWVQGEKLCNWSEAWLRSRQKTQTILEEKLSPQNRLAQLFLPIPVPEDWTGEQQLALTTRLDAYAQSDSRSNPIANLLADWTDCDRKIWFDEPSKSHLARWLSIAVAPELQFLEQVWQHHIAEIAEELAPYYRTNSKKNLLQQWLGLEPCETQPNIQSLGKYPRSVPETVITEFTSYWESQILRSEATILDSLIPNQQAGMEQIAATAFSIFESRPAWITRDRRNKLSTSLSVEKSKQLQQYQSPSRPTPLAIDATPEVAMQWAVKQYLPFRLWETTIAEFDIQVRESDRIAESFVDWIIQHYPNLKLDAVATSYLNYSVASLVQDLCKQSPVLWVVVDGLGWLDHKELLTYLTRDRQLAVTSDIQPCISILPTKTEDAKWSLYTQLPPNASFWQDGAGKGFPMMLNQQEYDGERYTDSKFTELKKALKQKKHQLYCWDTILLDKCYHDGQDWQNLYKIQRPNKLREIADQVLHLIQAYPEPDDLQIIIASDHGQIIGECAHLTDPPSELEVRGRLAIGITEDERFVFLEKERFGLRDNLSIVRGSGSFQSFNYTTNKNVIGSHGGLFPEEVVIGVSILQRSSHRYPVSVISQGEGQANQPGELEIIIDNPNNVPLTNLCLYINEFPTLQTGYPLEDQIPAQQKTSLKVPIVQWLERPPSGESDRLPLSGQLHFQFADTEPGEVQLDPSSSITIKQMFSSGFDSGLDDFF
jgi:serine/threonine protein kinase